MVARSGQDGVFPVGIGELSRADARDPVVLQDQVRGPRDLAAACGSTRQVPALKGALPALFHGLWIELHGCEDQARAEEETRGHANQSVVDARLRERDREGSAQCRQHAPPALGEQKPDAQRQEQTQVQRA